ncbi:MAG TPA: phage/plasmid primase, P4 family [Oscillospiraceae bacterium]|nr:phage/plasmid primase, P4 family [Oscillospiraceae bacterium]
MITFTNETIKSPDSELYKLISSPECDGNEFDELITAAAEYAMNNGLKLDFKLNAELAAEQRETAREWFFKDRNSLLSLDTFGRLFSIDFEPERIQILALLRERAAALKCKTDFESLLHEYEKHEQQRKAADYSERKKSAMLTGSGSTMLPPYIIENYNEKSGEVRYSVSCPLLADYIRKNSRYIFTRGKASEQVNRFLYSDGVYNLISDDELKGVIKSYVTVYDEALLKMNDIREVFQNLTTDLNFIDSSELNADESLVNFQNGLLSLKTMELLPHSPDVFSTIQIPCNWNENARGSPVFDSFINRFTDGDKAKQKFLLQYMGAALSNIKGYRMKKALFMVGEGNTGKSQLKGLTERLLGSQNYSNIELSQLEERFGSYNLFNKRLAGSSDMGYVSVKELKIFKQITGGDNIFMEDKGKSGFSGRFNGVLWFGMNELPKFGGDRGEWVYNRIIPFVCSNVIPENEQDKEITDKMYAERETIIFKAMHAAKQVIDNGFKYDIPECCQAVKDDYRIENSPTLQFYYECCQQRMGSIKDNCTCSKVYKVFQAWCKDNSRGFCPSVREFRKELSELLTDGDVKKLEIIKEGIRYYAFTLKLEVKNEYAEQYGHDYAS